MRYIIDRFEGRFAVCEDEKQEMVNIPVESLPADVKEGDVLAESNGSFYIIHEESEKIKADIKKLIEDVFE